MGLRGAERIRQLEEENARITRKEEDARKYGEPPGPILNHRHALYQRLHQTEAREDEGNAPSTPHKCSHVPVIDNGSGLGDVSPIQERFAASSRVWLSARLSDPCESACW